MRDAIILAGPNGAGKTTFANEFLPSVEDGLEFVNADEIAREVSELGLPPAHRDLRAGRIMLERIAALAAARAEFMFETTLASRAYAQKVPIWQKLGYSVALIYLRLPSVDHSIERVKRRVDAGGHDIPEDIIRRRYEKSVKYLDEVYKPIVNEWYVWDSLEGDFMVAERWDD